ncbi:hypothetical protein LOZ66_006804, partial [Ophidiomyces ophidiicola]
MAKVIDNYDLFIKTPKTTFREVEEHNAATQQLYHIRQKTSPQKYVMRFQQICVNTDWDDEALANMFYQGLFNNVKNEIACLEKQPHILDKMIGTAVRIGNRLYKQKMKKQEKTSWKQSNLTNYTKDHNQSKQNQPY